jgi:hypothetical protein
MRLYPYFRVGNFVSISSTGFQPVKKSICGTGFQPVKKSTCGTGFQPAKKSICGTGFQPVIKHGQDGRATWELTQKSLQSPKGTKKWAANLIGIFLV